MKGKVVGKDMARDKTKELFLYSSSVDFGFATIDEIKHAVLNEDSMMWARFEGYKVFISNSEDIRDVLNETNFILIE